jgi:hypothetical protein
MRKVIYCLLLCAVGIACLAWPPARAGVDQNGNTSVSPVSAAFGYTDHSGTTSAGAWLQISVANNSRHGFRFFNLGTAAEYITYTATSSAPTGTPSTTTNSTPGGEVVAPSGGVTSDDQDAPSGYLWVYCSAAQPFTEKEF